MKIAVLKIDGKIEENEFAALLKKIDQEKQDRIKRFLQYQDKQRCLFAELLARAMIMEEKGIRNSEISFIAQSFGKPVLQGTHLHFNTSHAGDWIVCVVDQQEVGIDVEQVDDIDLSISDNYFSKEEHQHIINYERPVEKFFDFWTLKESYIKFIGTGLSRSLNSFSIKFLDNDAIRVEADDSLLPDVYCKQYPIADGYKLAVCAAHNSFPAAYKLYTYDELVSRIINA